MSSLPLLTEGPPEPDKRGPRLISVPGQPAIPKKERMWSVRMKMRPFSMLMTTSCPCGEAWEVTQERQLDAFARCPKCGATM